MPTNRDINADITFVADLKSLVSTYEEIAVMRIAKVRVEVLNAREFREGLSTVFRDVRVSHQQQVIQALKKQQKEATFAHGALLLSTDSRLTGGVTASVSRAFAAYVKENQDASLIIVGQVGKEHLASMIPGRPAKFFSITEGKPNPADLEPLLEYLLRFARLTVFFPRFQNIIRQEPTKFELGEIQATATDLKARSEEILTKAGGSYLFEPSLEEIVDFFNKQIFAMVLQQTQNESWLSLLGSRVTAMEKAANNIDIQLQKLEWERRREQRRIRNKKQRDRLAGISLWQK